ncbi:MAG: condensation domain-containing protein [Archangium sp.]
MSRDGMLPLSFGQQRLWFIAQLAPGSIVYNAPFAARLKGPLDVAVLERSLVELVRRHEALRTTFVRVDGQLAQRISPEPVLPLPVESLEALSEAERVPAARRCVEEEARRPFDLEQGPLVRARDSYDLSKTLPRPPLEQQAASWLDTLFYRDLLKAAGQELPVSEEALPQMGPEALSGALEEASDCLKRAHAAHPGTGKAAS